MQNEQRVIKIKALLEAAFSPQSLTIEDESEDHIGHSGATDGRGHFNVMIVSDSFNDQSLIQRHQRIYQALGAMMEEDIHALSIKAKTPEEI